MVPSKKIVANGAVLLGDVSEGVVGTQVFQLADGGAGAMSVTAQKRVRADQDDPNGEAPWVDTPITQDSDGSDVAAGTGVTAFGVYSVKADGCDVQLTFAGVAGAVLLYRKPVLG